MVWTPPGSDGGSAVTDYEYRLDGGSWTSLGTTVSPATISGLTNGTLYGVEVRAVNVAGPGPASNSVEATPRTTPGAPTLDSATAGDGSIAVVWTPPGSDGGSAVTDFEFRLDGGSWTSLGTTVSPATISGLTNGTLYGVEVRAVNVAGAGPASEQPGGDTAYDAGGTDVGFGDGW